MSSRKDYFWNTLAGIINAAEVIVLSMIVTRFGKLSDAGVLSLAFAVSNVLMAVGAFGGRMFQASDVKQVFTYRMYLIHRFSSLGLMVVVLVVFLGLSGYETAKIQTVAIISYIYMIEVIENCIWGHYQLYNMLYVGARMFCTRWLVILASFSLFMTFLKDMFMSLLFAAILGTVVFVLWLIWLVRGGTDNGKRTENKPTDSLETEWFINMTIQTFPLFLAGFCALFINNIPKFAIDRYLNDEIQACFGFVAMPVFVIGLLNQFIYQPVVTKMSTEYNDGKIRQFMKNVNKQILEVVGISAICVIGATLIGIPILSLIYNTDLYGYRSELIILQFAGGFLALTGYFNVVLTIMRKQMIILRGYVGATVLGIVLLSFSVKIAGTIGASIGYLIIMALLFGYYYVSYLRNIGIGEDDSSK